MTSGKSVPKFKANLVLMNIVMPTAPHTKDGIKVLKQKVQTISAAHIVMFSSMGQQALIAESLKSPRKISSLKRFSLNSKGSLIQLLLRQQQNC